MSDLQGSHTQEYLSVLKPDNKGVHYDRGTQVIPRALRNAPPARLEPLLELKASVPDWYMKARESDRQHLKELVEERWRLQGELDQVLGDLQHDINAFAEPLLSQALKTNFNTSEDPNNLSLHLYVPSKIAVGIDNGASVIRRSSLLAAALHNFEEPETRDGAFRSGSGVYRNDAQGALQRDKDITPENFAALCRRLDIGGHYQTHIKARLEPQDPYARRILTARSIASEKAALKSSAFISRLKGDISAHAYDRLREVIEDKAAIQLYDHPLHSHRLSLMGFRLTGVVLFSAVAKPSKVKTAIEALTPQSLKFWLDWSQRIPFLPGQEYEKYKMLQAFFANGPQGVVDEVLRKEDIYQQSRLTGPLIAYVPDDPDHPLREYSSLADFMSELISQLRVADYQEFFSRFVAQKDKGRFFARVNERLKTITWQQRDPLDMGPWWRETAIENPDAEPITNVISGDLWDTLFRERRDKAITDARHIAVPTDDEDATTRWKRLTSYLDIGWNVFNFAAMLVPGLGEAMLGVMVGQMLADLAEGIEDWSKGDREEASAYLNGVLINFAQLALMGAGHVLPSKNVVPIKTSSFIDQLKPVQINGEERLWNPDLTAYEHPAVLPEDAQANGLGIHRHEGQNLLPLDGKNYAITQDVETGQHRLQHPTRPEAYQPVVEHNGAGAWRTEIDQPLAWDKARLMRRLGASAEEWPDETLEQILTVAGVSEDALRRLHVELDPPPVMLTDTLKRFRLYAEAGEVGQQILADQVPETLMENVARLMTDLPRWPEHRAVEVFDGPELKGASTIIGNIDATIADRIKLTRAEFRAGQLPWRTLETLNEQEVHELLGQAISSKKELRVQALKESLAGEATKKRKQLFEGLYKQHEDASAAQVHRLTDAYPQLPSAVAERLLQDATPGDLKHLAEKQTLPLRLREQARQAEHRVRVSRAYEGLYLEGLENNDTRRLELASLATLPGWSSDVRIEIREFSFTGKLHASVGPESAPIRKVLILEDEGGYQARDETNQHLHGSDDFYASLLRALPDNERKALGYDIFEGERLKFDLQRSPLDAEQFESALSDHPVRKPTYDPEAMRLRGGMPGYRGIADESLLRRRVGSLYPGFSDEQIGQVLGPVAEAAEARVSALEAEFNQLNTTLQRWMDSPTLHNRFGPLGVVEWDSRNRLYRAIRQCWQRTGPSGIEAPGIIGAQHLDLDDISMGRHLATFPELTANFDHVTSLSMRETNILSSQGRFLEKFRGLRSLDLGGNLLNRLPPVIGDLRHLTNLWLDHNQIVLTQQAVARLRGLTRLELLVLPGNPLGRVPDISQMPRLAVLNLQETGIDQWPVGLFGKPRPRHIYLNLKLNRLAEIPDIAPGSFRAELLGRTIVSREPEWMSPSVLEKLKHYMESVGMDPQRPYPPRGLQDSLKWAEGMPESLFKEKLIIWDELEDEIGSEKFFDVIRRLTESADFNTPGTPYRSELTAKVWRMLEAMYNDAELRETAFSESVVATECSDGATQLFNALGVKVLVKEAYALENPALVEAELVELARGKTRLDEIGAIARRRIAERYASGERLRVVDANGDVTGTIDEVEVQLAYMTDLAESLDLPWQSRGMLFRAIAKVEPAMIKAARLHVLGLEQGDLLAEGILEQAFWKSYLENTYRSEFDQLKLEMQGADEMDEFTAIKNLERTLTKQAIERAKLQRTEIPFTVEPAS
ncbi:dermonecrotic toxin domain-containing protein [Pseudomonas sp. H3(2019)]|uniref:dermonecrotic toxin domain-containing protein n=1 Tax=Pseudomonas sp. H3(2019) TaxID=2598724 RepID=UPI00118F5EDF|nr:DUF6543 domain-containing protein [Pseudomonas sp. H3(2019)]TVT82591.1 hypothetical protein FPT12_15510 [Pseudomonas sp. H3(2019)]